MRKGQKHLPESRAMMSRSHSDAYQQGRDHLPGLHRKQVGPGHPNWKGGRASRIYRAIAFAAHGTACQVCGAAG